MVDAKGYMVDVKGYKVDAKGLAFTCWRRRRSAGRRWRAPCQWVSRTAARTAASGAAPDTLSHRSPANKSRQSNVKVKRQSQTSGPVHTPR
eukprot:3677877-Pyramimonas_sp.AAC.2